MSEEPLNLVEIDSRLDQSRSEGVPEIMEMKIMMSAFVMAGRNARLRWLGSNRVPARLGKPMPF